MTTSGAPIVQIATSLGIIVLEIYLERAPRTAAAFARYVMDGRYIGGQFFRSVHPENDNGSPSITVVQACAKAGRTRLYVEHESTAVTELTHEDGVVSLARGALGSGSPDDFFICIGDQRTLDAGGNRPPDRQGFAAFGRVIDGLDVVKIIHAQPTAQEAKDDYMRGQILVNPVAIRAAEFAGAPPATFP
jgi:peptidyl-prolyl cis-trans isomerase A (cyclophilin A)